MNNPAFLNQLRALNDQGQSLGQISTALAAAGYRTKTGRPLSPAYISYALRHACIDHTRVSRGAHV